MEVNLMLEFDSVYPNFFDGSKHLVEQPLSSSSEVASDGPAAPEEWRRYIGVNPYGAEGQ
jgi:hypothetical protein